jgi:hypothetical protein
MKSFALVLTTTILAVSLVSVFIDSFHRISDVLLVMAIAALADFLPALAGFVVGRWFGLQIGVKPEGESSAARNMAGK